MKKFFRTIFYLLILGGIAYVVKNVIAPSKNEFSSASSGQGVMPANAASSLDEKPLGGKIGDDLLKILVCPEDKGALDLIEDGQYLLNPRTGYKYPIRDGIPVMLIEEGKKNQDQSLVNVNGSSPNSTKEKAV